MDIREVVFGIIKGRPTTVPTYIRSCSMLSFVCNERGNFHTWEIHLCSVMGASVNFICLAHPADTNLGGVVSSSGRKYTISTLWGCLGHHINTTELLKWILKEGLYPAVEKTRFYLYTEVARDILLKWLNH